VTRKKTFRASTDSKEDSHELVLDWARSFCPYIKHAERGKLHRRAIASANPIMRVFLYIIEQTHLSLSKKIPGATIGIGGEEKKAAIISTPTASGIPGLEEFFKMESTEDATKWNECLSPSAFAMMHKTFFDEETRMNLGLPPPSTLGTLFSRIAVAGNFLMSIKKIHRGKGCLIEDSKSFARLEWKTRFSSKMNIETEDWMKKAANIRY
jgi:hypothetical protein